MTKEATETTPAKAMRQSYSLCGWATFALIAFSLVASVALGLLSSLPALEAYLLPLTGEYFLYFNEALVGVSVLIGLLVLGKTRGEAPPRVKMSFRFYFCIFAVSVAASSIGNVIGRLWTLPSELLSDGAVSNGITEQLAGQDTLSLVLCVGVLAPVFEEFFFRKLLVDRLRPHGELLAILTSGLLFGLFHGNIGQYFYTFAVGILLAYLYCRTGSYLAVTLMHAAFNLLLGVLPMLFYGKVNEFLVRTEGGFTSEMLGDLPALLSEYALPLLGYGIQSLLVGVLTVTGVLVFIFTVKRVKIKPPPAALSVWDMGTNGFINSGMLTATVVMLGMTVLSLFLH